MENADKIEQTLLHETSTAEEFICQLRRLNAQNEQLVREIHRMGGEFHEEMSALKIEEKKDLQDYNNNTVTIEELCKQEKGLIKGINCAEEKIAQLKCVLKEAEKHYACALTEFNTVELKHNHVKENNNEIKCKIRKRRKELAELEAEMQRKNVEKKDKNDQELRMEELRDVLDRCTRKRNDLQYEVCNMTKEIRALKRQLDSLDAKICSMQPIVSNYKSSNRKMKNNIRLLEDEIDALKQKLMK